jgi:hypothetical protein
LDFTIAYNRDAIADLVLDWVRGRWSKEALRREATQRSWLCRASEIGLVEVVFELLAVGVDANSVVELGYSALCLAMDSRVREALRNAGGREVYPVGA